MIAAVDNPGGFEPEDFKLVIVSLYCFMSIGPPDGYSSVWIPPTKKCDGGGGGWIFKTKKFNKLYVHWLEYFILRA